MQPDLRPNRKKPACLPPESDPNSAKMKKPMMIYQGANDPRVPQSESDQMVATLHAQGTEVWYVLALDEGHGVAKKANAEAVRASEIVFLKKVLGTK